MRNYAQSKVSLRFCQFVFVVSVEAVLTVITFEVMQRKYAKIAEFTKVVGVVTLKKES